MLKWTGSPTIRFGLLEEAMGPMQNIVPRPDEERDLGEADGTSAHMQKFPSPQTAKEASNYTAAGQTVIGSFGNPGSGLADLNRPQSMTLDRKGNMYIADTNNSRVVRYLKMRDGNFSNGVVVIRPKFPDASGKFARGQPSIIALDEENNVFVSDSKSVLQFKLQRDGQSFSRGFVVMDGHKSGRLAVKSMAFDDEENLLLLSSKKNVKNDQPVYSVSKFLREELYKVEFDLKLKYNFRNPASMAYSEGVVYVADTPRSNTADEDVSCVVAGSFDQDGKIEDFYTVASTRAVKGVCVHGGQFRGTPGSMAFNAQGDMFVVDVGDDRVLKYEYSTVQQRLATEGLKVSRSGTPFAIAVSKPAGKHLFILEDSSVSKTALRSEEYCFVTCSIPSMSNTPTPANMTWMIPPPPTKGGRYALRSRNAHSNCKMQYA
jgi:hypothetical protein